MDSAQLGFMELLAMPVEKKPKLKCELHDYYLDNAGGCHYCAAERDSGIPGHRYARPSERGKT